MFDTPEQFFKSIPTELRANIEFRMKLHKILCQDSKMQENFIRLCRAYKPIIFNTVFWTFNPKKRVNHPFILRPKQIEAVETLDGCIQNGHDVGINKSREEGASEICCKLFIANCLLYDYNHFIVGSRKEAYVDKIGDQTTIFAKIDNAIECLPMWWKELIGWNPDKHRKNMLIEFPYTNSAIVGETTNESFSAGSRATAMLLDEFGRVDYSIAESIEGSVHDVSDCIVYSSTHWLGINHTFNNCLKKDSTKIIELLWYDNPEKNQGLYTSPSPGELEIIDKDYYSQRDLDNAKYCNSVDDYDLSEERVQFIVDGCQGLPPKVKKVRSPWQDFQEKKRRGNRRDWICNVWACPHGAADTPFDANTLEQIRETTITSPKHEGEIWWDNLETPETVSFLKDFGFKRLKWWGELPFGRPNQRHNYVIGVDPSYGLGSANSAIMIIDVNDKEQVGSWVDANTKPEQLADLVVALAYWIGGVCDPFIIWEANAGCGTNFTERMVYHGYYNVYTQRREDSKTRKKVKKWGWTSNEKAKENLLGELGVALSSGLSGDAEYVSLIIHDELLLEELSDYVFREKGKGIVASSRADLSTGALERHGDRGIAAGLCVLGLKEQGKGEVPNITNIPYGSFAYYDKLRTDAEAKENRFVRRWLY